MKLTAMLLATLPWAAPLAAQGPALGIELGYSRASFSGRDAGGVKLHEGAVAGAYMSVDIFSGIAFRPGILLSTKGGSTALVVDSAGNQVRLDLELVYIDFPVMMRGRFKFIGESRIIVSAGVLPGVRIGCATDVIVEGDFPLLRTPCQDGVLKSFDMGALGGIGFGVPIERSFLALELRLTQGMVSIVEDGDLRNRAATLLLTIPF